MLEDLTLKEVGEAKQLRDLWSAFVNEISEGNWNKGSQGSIKELIKTIRHCGEAIEEKIMDLYTDPDFGDLAPKERTFLYKEAVQEVSEKILADIKPGRGKVAKKIFLNNWTEEQYLKMSKKDWMAFVVDSLRYQKIASQPAKITLTAERAGELFKRFIKIHPEALELFAGMNSYRFIARYFFKGNMTIAFETSF